MCFCMWSSAKYMFGFLFFSWRKRTPAKGCSGGRSSSHEVIQLRLQSRSHLIRFGTAALLVIVAGLSTGLAGSIFLIQFSLVASGEMRARAL